MESSVKPEATENVENALTRKVIGAAIEVRDSLPSLPPRLCASASRGGSQ